MAAFLGTISEFSSTLESWTAYVERLVQYLTANKIEEPDQQRAVLLIGHFSVHVTVKI